MRADQPERLSRNDALGIEQKTRGGNEGMDLKLLESRAILRPPFSDQSSIDPGECRRSFLLRFLRSLLLAG
jgi:hypothetical protein